MLSSAMASDYHQFINRDLPLVERGCTSKAVFQTRREARTRISHGLRSNGQLDPYRCRYCGAWHVGTPTRPLNP